MPDLHKYYVIAPYLKCIVCMYYEFRSELPQANIINHRLVKILVWSPSYHKNRITFSITFIYNLFIIIFYVAV